MDSSVEASASQEEPAKKSPYDDLSREDLLKKCKGLLAIAQKAKQVKQESQIELDKTKEELSKALKEKLRDENSIRTLQELVESLTEQKLTYITDLDSAHTRHAALKLQLGDAQNKVALCEKQMAELSTRVSDLDSEVVSLRRQNQRLEKENEELISQLSQLEQAAAEQRQQLQTLEETVDKAKQNSISTDFHETIHKLNEKILVLESDLRLRDEKIFQYEHETKCFSDKLSQEVNKYEVEREKKEKANLKLKIYRDKIVKCSSCITQLKNTKFILLKTVKDYSESIPKWQDEMIKLSRMLSNQFHEITSENKNIKQQIIEYENQFEMLKKSIEQLQKENSELHSKNRNLVESLESSSKRDDENNYEQLNLQIKALESEKHILVKEKQTARDGIIELEVQNKKLSGDVKKFVHNIEELETRINFLECENTTLKNQLKEKDTKQCGELKEKLKTLQEQFDALKIENTNITDLNNLLKEEVETLNSSLERPTDDGENLSDLNVSLQTDIMKLETKLSAYKQENSTLLADMKEMRSKVKELTAANIEFEEIKAKMIGYKTENVELLNEMKEVNQVLKERGESISKQEKAIAEMERLIDTLEKDRERIGESRNEMERQLKEVEEEKKKLEDKINLQEKDISKINIDHETMQKKLDENEILISSLKEECERLKQQQVSGGMEPPNDDMSTSTISRAEDHARMKELDETFEDKYTKLRIFALKLKKKSNDLTQQLEASEAEKAKLEKILNDSGATTPNILVLQKEYERALNTIADLKQEIQQIYKENETLKISLAKSSREQVAVKGEPKKPDGDKLEASEHVDNPETVKQLQEKISELIKEVEAERLKNTNGELEKLKAELAKKEGQLSTEMEQHRTTKETLEKARRDVKKKSVLSLEMEDYERSMKDLTAKMEENKKKMVQMESTIDTQQGTINSLKTQIKLLEEQVKTEEDQNRLTREELHEAVEASNEKDGLIQAKNDVIVKLEQDIENSKRTYEELNIEMTRLIGEKEAVVLSLSQDKAELGSRLKRMEGRCVLLEETLRVNSIELEDLKTEFTSYKVRAQAVLRQNQTVDHSAEERLREELAAAQAQHDALLARHTALKAQLEEAESTCSSERRRAAEAAAEAARGAQRAARLTADLQRLTQQLDSERTQAELQVTTLTQCYKSQLAELETRLERETTALRRELAARAGEAAGRDDSDLDAEVNMAMLPREEGEGSEAAPSPPPKPSSSEARLASRSPVPLERLLAEGVPDDVTTDAAGLGLTAEQELHDLRRKLQALAQRVEHVTQLLAESERECARRTQLAELLKTEVRRARGSQHAQNTQYMKNVTLKFLTLPAGDERARLVPVLQKLLTLSNEETHTLQAVARGQDPTGKGGWGSYLPWAGK